MAMTIDGILARAEKIRLPVSALARRATMPPSTVFRFASRRSGNIATLERLEAAVREEEQALLSYLAGLSDRTGDAA